MGSVVAVTGGLPISGVTVAISLGSGATTDAGTSASMTTGATGAFSFPSLPLGSYTITFSKAGFIAKTITVGNNVAASTNLLVAMTTDTTAGVDAPTFKLTVTSSAPLDGTATDPYSVGYGTNVTVAVTNLSDATGEGLDAGGFTYSWSISTAPTNVNVSGMYSFNDGGISGGTAQFTTASLSSLLNDVPAGTAGVSNYVRRLGALGISPDQAGRYTVSVKITDQEGHNYTASQSIQSTWQTTDLRDVPVGVPVFLQGDDYAAYNPLVSGTFQNAAWANTSWTWSWVSCPGDATGATCPTISNANTQFPSFVPNTANNLTPYVLKVVQLAAGITGDAGITGFYGLGFDGGASIAGYTGPYGNTTSTVNIYANTWVGEMQNGAAGTATYNSCTGCHSVGNTPIVGPGNQVGAVDEFTPWMNTAHASATQRKMDGAAGSHFGLSCMPCHTTGWSPVASAQTTANGGFYYEMNNETGGPDGGLWTWNAALPPNNFTAMGAGWPALGALGGIQCENCHGPQAAGHQNVTANGQAYFGARVSFSTQVCASCHQEATTHVLPGLWTESQHSVQSTAMREATVESHATAGLGGADPQSGTQFCARCHSAQGFARYAQQLNNYKNGRYDFLTTDNMKLNDAGTNAPTVSWLQSIGLTYATVEPQSCQSCHDPHSNGAYNTYLADGGIYGNGPVDCSQQGNIGEANSTQQCMQLRIYDSLPGLPNGQGAFSGVGEGAVCMACHNGRNGEHTDTVNSAPYAETPHDSTATEALFGFNTFFMPEYNPSPHLAVTDTCSGCHVKLLTAAEMDAGIGTSASNHAFATDLSICVNCHTSDSVSGTGIQSQWQTEMNNLSTAIANAENALLTSTATQNICVQVGSISDTRLTGGSGKSSQVIPAVPFPLPTSTVELMAGTYSFKPLTSPSTSTTVLMKNDAGNGLSFNYYDVTAPVGGNTTAYTFPPPAPYNVSTTGAVYNPNSLSVAMYTIYVAPAGGCVTDGGVQPASIIPPTSTLAKAVWNYTELNNDGSKGIHNFPYSMAAINATMVAIGASQP